MTPRQEAAVFAMGDVMLSPVVGCVSTGAVALYAFVGWWP